jgi:hypothetical protein
METGHIHKNDVGTVFTVTIKDSGTALDISAATDANHRVLLFKSPDGSTTTQTASFVTAGTDGAIKFTTTAGLLGTVGTWQLQAKIILNTLTSVFYSDVHEFDVYSNLE